VKSNACIGGVEQSGMTAYTMLYFSTDLKNKIMKVRIKTTLIEMEVEDNPTIGSDNYTKRTLPELPTSLALRNVI
jgi:hypothetical protein